MDVRIEPSWKEVLQEEFQKEYFQELTIFVRKEYTEKRVFPPARQLFRAFDECPFHEVKVVILGQDPYHGPGQANGLCFSVNEGIPFPPSLLNIFKEINEDLQIEIPKNGDLLRWAKQGVLLLNATLTVLNGQAGAHQNKGWESFTDAVIHQLAMKREKLVFMLWGAYAQKKGAVIPTGQHLVLKSPHPSPLSAHRGFFGNKHFSKANDYLESNGNVPIRW